MANEIQVTVGEDIFFTDPTDPGNPIDLLGTAVIPPRIPSHSIVEYFQTDWQYLATSLIWILISVACIAAIRRRGGILAILMLSGAIFAALSETIVTCCTCFEYWYDTFNWDSLFGRLAMHLNEYSEGGKLIFGYGFLMVALGLPKAITRKPKTTSEQFADENLP